MELNYISNSTMKTSAKTGPYDEVMAMPSVCPCASSLTMKCKFLAQAVCLLIFFNIMHEKIEAYLEPSRTSTKGRAVEWQVFHFYTDL